MYPRVCAHGWESLHSACVLRLLVQFMYCNTLQSDGSKQCFIIKQVRLPFEGLTNVSCSPGPLWVCVQNIAEAVVVGEVATAAAIEVWEEWRLRIRVFKHHCPAQALIWLHLGTGCSVQWQFPRVQEPYCQSDITVSEEKNEHKPWNVKHVLCKHSLTTKSILYQSWNRCNIVHVLIGYATYLR